jgi:type I restriction enzyme, S subunit
MKDNKTIPKGYKPTPLGPIPIDWEVKHLGDVLDVFVGRDLKEDSFSPISTGDYKYPVYSNSVDNFGLYGFYDVEEYKGNCLTVVGRGVGLGTAFTRKDSFGAIGRLLVLYPKKGIEAHYVTEFINGKLNVFVESSSIPQLTGEQIATYRIAIPPSKEQTSIANLLSTWDKAINTLTQLIAQKELRKKWLMQQLLTGKKRLKGFSGEWKKLGAGEIFKSITKKGFVNEELLSATQDRGMIPRTMLEGRVTMPTTGTEGFKLVEIGDFVISLRSFQGGLEYSYYRGLVSPAYTVLKPKKEISEEFFKQYFKSYEFIGRLATAVIGIRDGKQISYDDFCIVKIPNPSFEEQTAFAQVLQAADNEISLLKAKAEKLREQKKGLMQQLLTGKKRLNQDLQDLLISRMDEDGKSSKSSNHVNPDSDDNLQNPKIQ